ncbi:MAG: hypothetical protein WCY62_00970 [Clostridia bacterium]
MNILSSLLKADLVNSFALNELKNKNNRKKAVGMIAVSLLVVLMCFIYIGGASWFISDILLKMGMLDILLVFSFIMPFMILFLMDIYKMPSHLFSFKDYDLLMSLPIRDNTVLTAKVLRIMTESYVWEFLVSFPIFLVYCIKCPDLGIMTVLLYILMFIAIPALPMSIGAVFALLIAKISIKMRNKNVVIIIGSFALLILIMGLSFSIQSIMNEQVIMNAMEQFGNLVKSFFMFDLYLKAVVGHDIVSTLILLAILIVPFFVFINIFGKSFKHINSAMMETKAQRSIKGIKFISDSPVIAIAKKEINFYTHCIIYITNTMFGMVLLFIGSIAAAVMGDKVDVFIATYSVFGFTEADTKMMVISVVITYCMILCSPCSASISLEGKNLWILKSMPVDEKTIFKGKLGLGLVVTIPIGVLSSIIIYIALGLTFVQWLVVLLLTISCGILASMLGLFVNLLFPKMEFKSPTEVVKQSAASGISIFAGMFIVIATIIIGSLLKTQNITLFVLFAGIAYLLLSAAFWYFITHKGVRIFRGL